MKSRVWRKRGVALVLGLALSVLLAELGYRLLRSGGLGPTTNPAYVTFDRELGWAYAPGTSARHASSEFDVEVRINARGFRGEDWPAPSPGRPRVLVLGDSFAFGWGVEQGESFSARLAELEPSWDVLNAAVSGYGTDQQLLLLRRLIPEGRLDLVVVLFCPNDLVECADSVAYGRHKPCFVLDGDGLELRGVPVSRPWLPRVSHLWRAIDKLRWERGRSLRADEHAQDWRLVQALYLQMKRELGPVPLLVLSETPQLANLARGSAVEHLDLSELVADPEGASHFPIDGHYTPAGHRGLARLLHGRAKALLDAGSE